MATALGSSRWATELPAGPLPLLARLPAELQCHVLSFCSKNDAVCLSLTSKFMYNFVGNLMPSAAGTHLTNSDRTLHCTEGTQNPSTPGMFVSRACPHGWNGLKQCHEQHYEAVSRRCAAAGLPPPAPKPKCRTRRWAAHCECYERKTKLYERLRGWMPPHLRFCAKCDTCTWRPTRGKFRARCKHASIAPDPNPWSRRHRGRRSTDANRFWTHRPRRGGFGHDLWKFWFNNAAMDKYEKRIRNGDPLRSEGARQRYDMRAIAARDVDSREDRFSSSAWSYN